MADTLSVGQIAKLADRLATLEQQLAERATQTADLTARLVEVEKWQRADEERFDRLRAAILGRKEPQPAPAAAQQPAPRPDSVQIDPHAPKTELRLSPHTVNPGQSVVELWHEGVLIGTVVGAAGPGVRIITKHPILPRDIDDDGITAVLDVAILVSHGAAR